ncbi:MAG: fused MFS/spermidine synthase, partial [Nitrospinota bacterium]|nr:fused MFS/spermidine synthase [Nitrospinota bacterium]
PLITSYLLTRGGGEASIGHVYAANTLGAIAGVILGSQFIMTMLGLEYVVIAGAVMDIAVGGWLFRMAAAGKEAVNKKVVAGLGALAFIAAVSALVIDPMSATFSYARAWNYSTKAQDVAFHKDGKTATVDVFLDKEDDSYWTLNENGLPQAYLGLDAPKNDEVTNTLLGALPWDVNPSISSVAVVGLGSGLSASVALEIPSISRMDVVEIEPAMVEGSRRLGGRVAKVHNDPRVWIHIDDARAYFASSGNKYDLIVSEPSHIWVAGVAGLFTTEFYSMARRSLNDGGMLAQWMHLHDQAPELVASVMAAISANFEDYQVYLTWDGNILVLARKSARVGRPTGEVFKIPQIRERLRWVGIESANDFYIRWLGGKKSLDPFFRSFGAPMNSDYHPYLSFGAIRAKYYQMDAFALGALRSSPAAIIEGLEGARMPEITEPLGQNPYLRQAGEIGVATSLFFALTGNGADQEKIDPGMAELAGNIGVFTTDCPTGALGRAWLSELNKAAFIMLPYLDRRRLATIWGRYIDSPCLDNIPSARSWLLLHQAVGGRDFQTAGQIARRLLPAGPLPYTQENIHLVSVAALADIREGKEGDALALLKRLEDGRHTGDNYHLRLLAAEGHGASR